MSEQPVWKIDPDKIKPGEFDVDVGEYLRSLPTGSISIVPRPSCPLTEDDLKTLAKAMSDQLGTPVVVEPALEDVDEIEITVTASPGFFGENGKDA